MAALDPVTDFSFINGTGPVRLVVGVTTQAKAAAIAADADNLANLGEGTIIILQCSDDLVLGTVQSDGSIVSQT
jgi:hypothetical protein